MARHGIQAALNDLRNSGMQLDPQDPITQAMTVRLRAPEGKVIVEAGTPETQWVESTLGLLQEDYASWRWTITPKWPGSAKLQFLVSVRTVSHNGLMAEAALPDQTIDVAGATNVLALLQKYAVWGGLLAGAIGIGVAAEHYLRVFNRLLGH